MNKHNDYTQRDMELRAADFYASIRKPESEWKSIDDLDPQLTEFEHRVRAGDYDNAHEVLSLIDYDFLHLWGHYARIIELREKLLEHLTDPNLQAENLNRLGRVYRARGLIKQAIEFHEKALCIARETDNHSIQVDALGNLGCALRYLGQIEQAINRYEQALAIACKNNFPRGEGWQGHLGIAYRALEQFEQAIESFNLALANARELEHPQNEVAWLSNLGETFYVLKQFDQAEEYFENALGIARTHRDHRGESYQLLGLGKVKLSIGNLFQAQEYCAKAWDLEITKTSYQAARTLGIIHLHQRALKARETFVAASKLCRVLLDKTAGLYEPRYALAAALVGIAVCDPRWADKNERTDLLVPSLTEYRRALENCAAPGIVADARRDLELIQAAGIEGLEPVFKVLKMTAD